MEKNLSLYGMTSAMLAVLEAEEVNEEMMEAAFGAITDKSNRIAHFIRDVESAVTAHKDEEKRIADRRKAMENKVKQLKGLIQLSMERLEIDKVQAGTFTLALQNNPPALEIEDGAVPPAEYCIIIPEQRTWDKAKVKDDIKAGKVVEHARLTQGRSLRIR